MRPHRASYPLSDAQGRVHILTQTVTALLDARVEGALLVTPLSVQSADGLHWLYQGERTWHAVARGHTARVPNWLGEFLHAALLTSGAQETAIERPAPCGRASDVRC